MSTKDDAPPRYEDIVMPDWPRHSQFPAPQANAPSVAEHNGPPPPSVFKRTRYRINKLFSRLDSPWPAILMAMAITAGTTYLVARHVIRLRSEATVDGNSETWKSAARQHVYDPCYLGCADCKDPAYAWNACAQTFFVVGWSSPQGNVSVDCNANKMWNWAHRYPEICLAAVGENLRHEALEAERNKAYWSIALVILTVLAGIIGGVLTHKVWSGFTARCRRQEEAMREEAQGWPRLRDTLPRATRRRRRSGVPSAVKRFFTSAVVLLGFGGRANAWACKRYGNPYTVHFANTDQTIGGSVHGWLSDCIKVKKCATNSDGEEDCTYITRSRRQPWDFVQSVLPMVRSCGFYISGDKSVNIARLPATMRIANPGIEKTWWVTIKVSGYNVTRVNETDQEVWCLHSIGG